MIVREVEREWAGVRLDAFVSEVTELSRSAAVKLIESGEITVLGAPVSKKYALKAGDTVEIKIPEPEPYEAPRFPRQAVMRHTRSFLNSQPSSTLRLMILP